MTFWSLLGLTLFNLFLLAVGAGVLWGVRGWRSWTEFGRLSGLAYLLGTAAFGSVLVLELVIGIPISLAGILVTGAVITAGGVGAGCLARRARPGMGSVDLRRLSLPVAGFLAATLLYFEALFRSGRLRGLIEWDAWSFWIPKAKAIYYFGGLDEQFFRDLPGPSYPPLMPGINASAFHFMGSPDVVTLHLQSWFLCLGFVGAAVGLLAPRVRWPLLWPFVLLMLVMPTLTSGALQPIADFPLDYFFALGALLIALALVEQERWQFISAALCLGAAMLTKREGLMLTVCVLAAALVVSVGPRRTVWPRLGAVGLGAAALAVPWIAWFSTREYSGWGPEAGGTGLFANLDRAWPSLKLTLSTFFDYDLWLVAGILAVAAVVVSFLAGVRLLSSYFGLVLLFCLAGFTWITWGLPSLPITKDAAVNPIGRVTGAIAVLSSIFVPLLLQQAWDRSGSAEAAERRSGARITAHSAGRSPGMRLVAPYAVVIAGVLAYPVAVMAGGLPHFPSRADCVRPATTDGEGLEVVFGHLASLRKATELQAKAVRVGFQGTQVTHDGCGRYKVAIPGVPSIKVGEEIIAEARSVGLDATLEQAG